MWKPHTAAQRQTLPCSSSKDQRYQYQCPVHLKPILIPKIQQNTELIQVCQTKWTLGKIRVASIMKWRYLSKCRSIGCQKDPKKNWPGRRGVWTSQLRLSRLQETAWGPHFSKHSLCTRAPWPKRPPSYSRRGVPTTAGFWQCYCLERDRHNPRLAQPQLLRPETVRETWNCCHLNSAFLFLPVCLIVVPFLIDVILKRFPIMKFKCPYPGASKVTNLGTEKGFCKIG